MFWIPGVRHVLADIRGRRANVAWFPSSGVHKIWKYKKITIQRRRKAGLPDLYDNDDLPDPLYDQNHIHVLTEKEQADLHYRTYRRHLVILPKPDDWSAEQHKFMQSQTWYRPHGTFTHRVHTIFSSLHIHPDHEFCRRSLYRKFACCPCQQARLTSGLPGLRCGSAS